MPDTPLYLHAVQLVNWMSGQPSTSSSSSARPQVELLVPPGQLAVGATLIKALYFTKPDLTQLSEQEKLQLIRLADSYGISKVVSAVIDDLVETLGKQLRAP